MSNQYVSSGRQFPKLHRWIALHLAIAAMLSATLGDLARAQSASSPMAFRAYPISNIKVTEAARRLRSMLADVGEQVEILSDKEHGRLLVQGNAATQRLAAQIIQTIDQRVERPEAGPTQPQREVRGYPVKSSDLTSLAEQLRRRFPPAAGVRIATDPRVGQVIVVAAAEVQAKVAAALRDIDVAPTPESATNPAPTTESTNPASSSHQLRHVSWQQLEAGLQQISGGRFRVTAATDEGPAKFVLPSEDGTEEVLEIDRRRGRVTFLATATDVPAWQRAVTALDRPAKLSGNQLEVVPIQNADPNRVRLAVAALRSGGSDDGASMVKPRPKWGGRLVSRIFQEAGGAQAPAGGGPDAAAVQGGGLIGPVDIEYLEGLDVIIIRGRPSDLQRVQQIIDDIERLSVETQPVVVIYHLLHINGAAAAALVEELYEEILSPRQGQVSIRALVDPNAILLIGREESVAVVKDLIERLDQPAAPASQFQVFRLKWISAVDAELTVRNFFVNRPGYGDDERAGLGTRVQVSGDYRSNSLIVQASPRDLEEVRRLITNIDVDATENLAELRVFRLRNALAEDLAEVLQTAITGPADGGGAGGQGGQAGATQTQASLPSATLQFMLVTEDRQRMLKSGILSDAQVTADANINALLVRAPAESMELFKGLIEHLDQLPSAEAAIKVFEMKNGDATSLASMVQQLFGQQVTVGQGNAQFALGGFGQAQQALQAGTTGGESSLVPLRISVDIRTNSIIVSASEGDLNVVEAILTRLDLDDVETRVLRVVRLQNAPAESVANSITSFLTSQRDLIQQQLIFNQAISPYEQIEREVIVVAEPISNSLIVSATPRYYEQILQAINDLDFRPKMVMVQVVIAEIVLTDEFEFGIEFGLQDSLLFDRGLVLDTMGTSPSGDSAIPGFNFNDVVNPLPNLNTLGRDVLAAQGLTNFGVGRTNGGLVLSAANESLNILIRALQQQGQAQILARPQIMTLHNQLAFVQVGQTISRITGTTITNGIAQTNVADVETGLILRVQPLINDDGVVVMSVEAERSRLGDEADGTVVGFDQNGMPVRSAPIDRTTAQTIVNAKSGQTVVFAGLITSRKQLALRRVPWISDIPVVGRLFEFEDSEELRTELMIIMTPHIVESDEDYEWIKAVESERMSWCLADVANLHGNVGLQGNNPLFCCDNLPVIYPHSDPAGMNGVPMPAETLAPPIEFSQRQGPGPLFRNTPVVTEANQNPQARPGDNASLPLAPGFQTTVTYGPPPAGYSMPAFQTQRVETPTSQMRTAAPFGRLPQTR